MPENQVYTMIKEYISSHINLGINHNNNPNNNLDETQHNQPSEVTFNPILLQHLGKEIKNFMEQNGIKELTTDPLITWNMQHKCWEYVLKLSSDDNISSNPNNFNNIFSVNKASISSELDNSNSDDTISSTMIETDQFTANNSTSSPKSISSSPTNSYHLNPINTKTIRVRLIGPQSNFQQTSKEFQDRANNLFDSIESLVLNLSSNQKYLSFKKDIIENLKYLNPEDDESFETAKSLLQYTTNKIAQILVELEKNQPINFANNIDSENIKTPKNVKAWLKLFKKNEAIFDSKREREILLHVYQSPPVQINPITSEKNSTIWIIDSAIPISNIPSTLRNGTLNILPNWFISKNEFLELKNNSFKKLYEFEMQRSSSFPPIEEQDLEIRNKKATEIAKNKLKFLVINEIIKEINLLHNSNISLNENIFSKILQQAFNRKMLVMTLLNLPFNIITDRSMNERDQFNGTKEAFQNLKHKDLMLNLEDVNYIQQHLVNQKLTSKMENFLLHQPIQHQEIFHNFASSGHRKFTEGGLLAPKIQKETNNAALKLIKNEILHYFVNHVSKIKELDLLENLINQENSAELEKYAKDNLPDLKSKKIIAFYIKYLNLLKSNKTDNDKNFLVQVFTGLLVRELNIDLHVTCKSGEDRTGAIVEATNCAISSLINLNLLNEKNIFEINKEITWNKFKEIFWNNYPRTVELSTSHQITDMNAIGAKGLQSQHNNNPRSKEKFMILSNKMARTHKIVFEEIKKNDFLKMESKFKK